MSYSMEIINYAHTLFLQGKSFAVISEIIKDKFKKEVRPQTVFNWSKKMNWEESRKEVMLAVRKENERRAENHLSKIESRVETLMDNMFNELLSDNSPKLGSREGAMYAYKSLAEFYLKIKKENGEVPPAVLAQMIMEVLMEIPSIRSAIKKEWKQVAERLSERMPRAMIELNEQGGA